MCRKISFRDFGLLSLSRKATMDGQGTRGPPECRQHPIDRVRYGGDSCPYHRTRVRGGEKKEGWWLVHAFALPCRMLSCYSGRWLCMGDLITILTHWRLKSLLAAMDLGSPLLPPPTLPPAIRFLLLSGGEIIYHNSQDGLTAGTHRVY